MYGVIDMIITAVLSLMGGGVLGFGIACVLSINKIDDTSNTNVDENDETHTVEKEK